MAHHYRCPICQATSPPLRTRTAALAEGARHRALEHGGYTPDGERFLRRRQHFNWRSFLHSLLILASLPVADWLWQHR